MDLLKNLDNMITAEKFIETNYGNLFINNVTATILMIEFAKLHVEAALKAAIEKIEMDVEYDTDRIAYPLLEEQSILNAYPLENIK